MRFCLNCGKPLPDAPIVFNLQNPNVPPPPQSQAGGPGSNPFGQSVQTQFGGNQSGFNQNQFSMVPPARKSGGKKIFIAIAGVVFLFFLVLVGVAGIIGYNMMKQENIVVNPSPSPSAAPSASPSATKSASPTVSPKTTASPVKPSNLANVKVKFDRVWVDYNVTKDGKMGMRVHVKFDVSGMKGVDSNIAVYFQKEDGSNVMGGSGIYRSKDGRLVALQPLKPAYDDTVYTDLEVFVPFDQLNSALTKGKYNLKMDIDLTDDDQTLLEHLTFHDFQYEKF